MARVRLSTTDNPYNPFTQYDMWRAWDESICGYYTSQYLARIVVDSPELSGPDEERATEEAIDEIIAMNLPLTSPVTGTRTRYIKIQAPSASS